jgi:hypothetical protein
MKKDIKLNMKKRARIAAGIVNLLQDDVDHIKADANDFDLICLEESIKDVKTTLQMLTDNITEIEYMLYLANSREPY